MNKTSTSKIGKDAHLLSAVEICVTPEEFSGVLTQYPGDEKYAALRDDPDVFAYRMQSSRRDGEVLLLPLALDRKLDGVRSLPVRRYRRALARLIEMRLPEVLPESLNLKRKRFALERLKHKEDLIELSLRSASISRPEILSDVSKHIRTRFQVRTEYVQGRGPILLMALQFGVALVINASLADLIAQRVLIDGLRVERERSVGYVTRLQDSAAQIEVETESGIQHWPAKDTTVVPSSEAAHRILAHALGDQLDIYHRCEAHVLAAKLSGRAYTERLKTVATWLSGLGAIRITNELALNFGDLITFTRSDEARAVLQLPAIDYCFSRDRTATAQVPARGLAIHGPFDGDTFDKKEPTILVVHPHETRSTAEGMVRALRNGLRGSQAYERGFVATYRLARLDTRFLSAALDSETASKNPGKAYISALEESFDPSTKPDAALVLLRDADADLPDPINPYASTKAWLLSQGIPSQSIRISKATAKAGNLQYILQDLSVALYAKLGGSPWTVLPSTPVAREVVLGMAYSETQDRFKKRRRYMGIATVFSSDGTYILGASSPQCNYDEYPEVLADTVRKTIRRLAVDQRWGKGDLVRLVVHMGKPLTRHDISTLTTVASAELVEGVEFETAFLQIREEHPFTLVCPGARGRRRWVETLDGRFGHVGVGEAVPERGTVVDLGRSRRLLAVTGPQQLKQEGGTPPRPLLIELHPDSTYTEISALTRQIFSFTGLSWKSVRPVAEPVTLLYPRLIARLVSRLSAYPEWSDELMTTYLLRSRWFL